MGQLPVTRIPYQLLTKLTKLTTKAGMQELQQMPCKLKDMIVAAT